jgi:HlyD family secretion protein
MTQAATPSPPPNDIATRARSFVRRRGVWLAVAAGLVVLILVGRGFTKHDKAGADAIPVEPVERRSIAVTIEATGTVEPIDLIEIKSKASGQIVNMPVEVGSVVKKGDLLAQIDPRDVQNQYAQTLAALKAAQSKVDVSNAQKQRSDQLYQQQVITAPEHEAAVLDLSSSQASLVKARTDLDLAQQRRDDATLRAPIAGTVIAQTVSNGQVISSATSSASGGTSLLTMADLSRVRMRALVSESDVGNVRPGQTATITVDAYPQQSFVGTVEKVEPQAVVQQSLTLFPVLISLRNDQGLLLPGMNGEVSMLVNQRDNVLAVPVDAVRSVREIGAVAVALGMNGDTVRARVQRQVQAQSFASRAAGDSGAGGGFSGARRGGAGGGPGMGAAAGVAGASADPVAGGGSGGPPDSVRAAWRRMREAGIVPSDSARAAFRRMRGGAGSRGPGGWGGGGSFGGGGAGASGATAGGSGAMGSGGRSFAGGGGGRGRAQVVFVKTAKGLEPRAVRIGISDFDYAEVVDGLKEGEQVALLGVAEAMAQRKQTQSQIRQRVGTGPVPGAGGGGAGRGGGGAGGGGGTRGGGGGR